MNSFQAYYLIGRVWQRLHFELRRLFYASYRFDSDDDDLVRRLGQCGLPAELIAPLDEQSVALCEQSYALSAALQGFLELLCRRLPGEQAELRWQRVDAVLANHFLVRRNRPDAAFPWVQELAVANAELQQDTARGGDGSGHLFTGMILESRFVTRHLDHVLALILGDSPGYAPVVCGWGRLLEEGVDSSRRWDPSIRSGEIAGTECRWRQIAFNYTVSTPAEVNSRLNPNWSARLSQSLRDADRFDPLGVPLENLGERAATQPSDILVVVEDVHRRIMEDLGQRVDPSTKNAQVSGPEILESAVLGISLQRTTTTLPNDTEKNTYGIVRQNSRAKPLAAQLGCFLWGLITAEKESPNGQCEMTVERARELLIGYSKNTGRNRKRVTTDTVDQTLRTVIAKLNQILPDVGCLIEWRDDKIVGERSPSQDVRTDEM